VEFERSTFLMVYPILITGASRGLGKSLAIELSKKFHVIAVARTTGGLEALDDQIKRKGGKATLAPIDLTDINAVRHLCKMIYDRWGGLHLWAHCAIHAAPLAPANFIAERDWEKSIKLNITSTGFLITNLAPLLGQAGTALFFKDKFSGQKFFGSYGSTKAAQILLATSWQNETVNTGPKIKILSPAPMPTATRGRFFPGEDREALSSCEVEAKCIVSELGFK